MKTQNLRSFFILLTVISGLCTFFFGLILSSQMSAFYVDLLSIASDSNISSVDMVEYMALLDKYQYAWWIPQVVAALFAFITVGSLVAIYFIGRKT